MGSWQLEVFRMTLYVSFPVGLFLLFNYPPFYEKTILEGRRSIAAAYDPVSAKMLEEYIAKNKAERMEETLRGLKQQK